ncbi:MAG TPA: malto-oligosyltrehalose trehalohydrolase [Xanthobacteraceae bacterium]|jgi:maltooligosyltrehalose trehalohydrolase|nr:malto-oligosyltrehalose trehalohydrolase [Xanthobacteraceae bacterium]
MSSVSDPTHSAFAMRFGATLVGSDGVEFQLLAPKHNHIRLKLHDDDTLHAMQATAAGWHACTLPARPGSLYQFVLPDGLHVPDPASRFQPQDAHGPSEVIDPAAYGWQDGDWKGRPWEESVLYELHVGAFTPEGTFCAAIDKLDTLAALGITAIELMPVAEFPGRRNWGYDGVLWFAPDAAYGRPDDLKALVDAAHARGLMVFLDVVYNHFGPDGNYLSTYAPIFTETHHTPWGAAVNYDAGGAEVMRDLVIANALFWIHEYHFDGLRLDAVHAILDDSPDHILERIAQQVRASAQGRYVHLILENEDNEASRLARNAAGLPLQYTAQWNDDVHHVLHTAASGESSGYYVDYAGDTGKLGRALAEGFAFQGEMMPYRDKPRGEPSAGLPPTAFVSFIQNHDQVGNRALGERLTAYAPAAAVRAVAAIYLLAPQVPMIFMGEEWAATQPFPFFCDFAGDLAQAIRDGRRKEFARFPEFQDLKARERIPDPTAEATFLSAKLDWDEATREPHAACRAFYQSILAVRRAEIVPRLRGLSGHAGHYDILAPLAVRVTWSLADASVLTLHANLTDEPLTGISLPRDNRIWSEGRIGDDTLGAWGLVWSVAAASGNQSVFERSSREEDAST